MQRKRGSARKPSPRVLPQLPVLPVGRASHVIAYTLAVTYQLRVIATQGVSFDVDNSGTAERALMAQLHQVRIDVGSECERRHTQRSLDHLRRDDERILEAASRLFLT